MPEAAAEKPKVIDIMAALEASVKAAKDARSRHPSEQGSAKEKTRKSETKTAAKPRARKAAAKKSA
jgi:DNA end-binding protein Ku